MAVEFGQKTKPFYFFPLSLISNCPSFFDFRTSKDVSSAFGFLIFFSAKARRNDVEGRVIQPGQCNKIIHRYIVVLCNTFIARRPGVRTMIERSTPDGAMRAVCKTSRDPTFLGVYFLYIYTLIESNISNEMSLPVSKLR